VDDLVRELRRLQSEKRGLEHDLESRDERIKHLQQQLAAADCLRRSLEHARDVALKVAAGHPRRSTDRAAFDR
jgi:hypothetical protein